jgi:hypothetical protein
MSCEAASGLQAVEGDLLAANGELLDAALAARVRDAEVSRVTCGPSAAGPPWIALAGEPLCDRDDPLAEAAAWARKAGEELVGTDLAVVFGLGLGYHLEALRRLTDVPLVVLEPSLEVQQVALSTRRFDLQGLRIVQSLTDLRDHLAGRLKTKETIRVLSWTAHGRVFPTVAACIGEAVRRGFEMAFITSNTLRSTLPTWTRNVIRNLPTLVGRVPACALEGGLRRRAAVIVAAGPSLDKNVHLLRRYRDRVTVFGVNTSVGALERAGVRADFVVSVERVDTSSMFEGHELNRSSAKLLDIVVNPAVHRLNEGPVLPFVDSLAFFAPLGARVGLGEGIVPGGSVANTAFNLCRMMGADPIVLIGQDLAYTAGRAYAKGTLFEEMGADVRDGIAHFERLESKRAVCASMGIEPHVAARAIPVEGWGGGTVWTTADFNYFRTSFESEALAAEGVTLINATEGGARIAGFEERRLLELLEELEPRAALKLPDAPRVDGEVVQRVLENELRAAAQVAREARVAAQLGTAAALNAVRGRIHHAFLAFANAWPALRAHDRAEEPAAPSALAKTIEERAVEVADEIVAALTVL